jgi:hypothetical protein
MEKGISLRQKRTGKLKISNPTLISAPRAATTNTVEIASVSSQRQTPNGSTTTLASTATRPRERTRDDRTADLVKRRYSTRLTGAQDLGLPDEPVPSLPSIPKQFTIPPPSRDGGSSIRSFRNQGVDIAILNDPNFDADECKYPDRGSRIGLIKIYRCCQSTPGCIGRRHREFPTRAAAPQKSSRSRYSAKCLHKSRAVHQD